MSEVKSVDNIVEKEKIYNRLLKDVYTFDVEDNPLVKKNSKKYKFHYIDVQPES